MVAAGIGRRDFGDEIADAGGEAAEGVGELRGEGGDVVEGERLISARYATRRERRVYEEFDEA